MPQNLTAESSTDPAASIAVQRIGRYLLFDAIAAGGMATVHLGRLIGSSGFSRVVAIKRLHTHLTFEPSFVSMLLDEARLVARVRHPNVVPVLDIADLPGELCLVMEYIDGEALSSLLRSLHSRAAIMPVPIAAAIMAGALIGLHAAHEATSEAGGALGIVHRDVSPQNIMVGRDGLARVLDFGIAYAVERIQVTRDGQIKGKLAYMAPEQVAGSKVDRRTDVYAASVVLWELLTGRKLFAGDNTAHTMRLITDSVPLPPSHLVAALSPELDTLVLKALSRDPKERFATAAEMASALENTVSLASQQEISRWVTDVAGPSLAARAAKVTRIEQHVDEGDGRAALSSHSSACFSSIQQPAAISSDPSQFTELATADGVATAPTSPGAAGSSKRTLWFVGAAAALAAGVLAVLANAVWRTPAPAVQTAQPLPSSSAVEPLASSSPLADPPPPSTGEVSAATSSSTSPSTSGVPTRKLSSPPPRPKACNPPWTVDKDGVRVPKKDCF